MGIIMNRFDMLMQLRQDIERSEGFGKGCNRFVLSCVIVHDTNDRDLINLMNRKFVDWAEMTGDDFLFITFIPSSKKWRNSKYCCNQYCFDKNSLMVDSRYTVEDSLRTLPLLRDNMDLPKSGSYLMVTDNLSSNSFYRVATSAETIEHQLRTLTEYCNDEAVGRIHSPKDFKHLLDGLNAETGNHSSTFIDILVEFTSMVSKKVSSKFNSFMQQFESSMKAIASMKERLKSYRGDDFEGRLFHLYECMDMVYKEKSRTDYRNIRSTSVIGDGFSNSQFLDGYSAKLLSSFTLLSGSIRHCDDLDYSGLTIYLGKIVENEMNLSVEQMMRHAMDIDMPEYYNRYCPKKGRVDVKAGTSTVNVNQYVFDPGNREDVRLKSVPMGTMLHAYKDMLESPQQAVSLPINDRLVRLDDEMMDFFRDFSNRYRNPAGHRDDDSQTTFLGAKSAFSLFMDRYLRQLYDIRRRLGGADQCQNILAATSKN